RRPPPPLPPVRGDPPRSPGSRRDRQPDLGRTIAVGEIVSSRVTPDDPNCGDPYRFRCQYFRLPGPQGGVLGVTIRWNAAQHDPYPLDLDVIGPSGAGWVGEIATGPQRIARGRVPGASTYVIEVWSFVTPDEPLDLITSLEQR